MRLASRSINHKWAASMQMQSHCETSAPGVMEVFSDHRGDTFRAVYTVKLAGRVYVLHAFQKKSKTGIATPKAEIDLIKQRLKRAIELHATWEKQHG